MNLGYRDFRGPGNIELRSFSTVETFEGLSLTSDDRPVTSWNGSVSRSVLAELLYDLFSLPLPLAGIRRSMGIVGMGTMGIGVRSMGIMDIAGILSALGCVFAQAVARSLVISRFLTVMSSVLPTGCSVTPGKTVIETTRHLL